jgi:hypothetical protein
MQTTTKTTSHYSVMGTHPIHGFITLDVTERFEDALTYRTIHSLTDAEVWVTFTDGSSEQVA